MRIIGILMGITGILMGIISNNNGNKQVFYFNYYMIKLQYLYKILNRLLRKLFTSTEHDINGHK